MTSQREEQFERFVRERRTALVRTATTLTAGDAHLAEDLVQGALIRVYLAGPGRIKSSDAMYAYTRRAVVNGLIDHRRRPFFRRERATDSVPDVPAPMPHDGGDSAVRLLEALRRLPVGMRAAVVLRHVEGLSVEETADALGCSTGNVKSQTARGLERMRELLDTDQSADHGTTVPS